MRKLLLLLPACIDPVDPQWSLNHDHVVAARATPPRIHAGDTVTLDALVAHAGAPTTIERPLTAAAGRHQVVPLDGRWQINAPVIAPRAEGPIAVGVMMTFARGTDRALSPVQVKKTVWLGESAENPAMPDVTVGGAPAGDALMVPKDQDVYLSTSVPSGWRVNWLTSAGTLFQDDEATSYLHVLPTDAQQGELACVIRDDQGGVVWKVWPIAAE